MSNINFSLLVNELLDRNPNLKTAIQHYANTLAVILEKNDLPFFPYYTDHGIAHIEAVLKSSAELIPEEARQVLTAEDATVLIGATLLHDIAMLVKADGFLELITENSRFQPVGWIKAELPWCELWQQYEREAKRFSDKKLAEIIGENAVGNYKFSGLPKDKTDWTEKDSLIIGEFIRRHHTRLAHEIALYGFPGSTEEIFPILADDEVLKNLADLIGLTARSHGVSLRLCQEYLELYHPGALKPCNVAAFYPMALLRVADYLQITCARAPWVLFQLSKPTSLKSWEEWEKHKAVINITKHRDNPMGCKIEIGNELSLDIYLKLQELIAGLQRECDHATVVLSEVYGRCNAEKLNQLTLNLRRVYSSLDDESFRKRLPYIPERTGFSVDPNLLSLLVKPLYGDYPSVGIRELMQNSMDAVRELETWCELHHENLATLDLPNLAKDADVLIDYIQDEHGGWLVRIQDRGIGMTHETLQNYFLRAGASFRRSETWQEYLDDKRKPKVLKAGRFGIGAFAVFLLGQSFTLWTRHVSDKRGFTFTASVNSDLIEIRRCSGLKIGTTIEVHLESGAVERLKLNKKNYQGRPSIEDLELPVHDGMVQVSEEDLRILECHDRFEYLTDWAAWKYPKIVQQAHPHNSTPVILAQHINAPIPKAKPDNEWFKQNPEWSVIYPKDFDAVFWTFDDDEKFSCNGISIYDCFYGMHSAPRLQNFKESWAESIGLRQPGLAIMDSQANLPLTLQRYELTDDKLTFIDELNRDIGLSIIANYLICAPESWQALYQSRELQIKHPLIEDYDCIDFNGSTVMGSSYKYFSAGLLRWCCADNVVIPADPWFYSLLDRDKCFVYGCISEFSNISSIYDISRDWFEENQLAQFAITEWNMFYSGSLIMNNGIIEKMLNELVDSGVAALGHKIKACSVHFSSRYHEFPYGSISVSPEINVYQPPDNWVIEEIKPNTTLSYTNDDINADKPSIQRKHFSRTTGDIDPVLDLAELLEMISAQMDETKTEDYRARHSSGEYIFYVAEIHTKKPSQCKPESFLAKLWYDILGANPIPFDAEKREVLIEKGRAHPELKRHIEAWEIMKALNRKD